MYNNYDNTKTKNDGDNMKNKKFFILILLLVIGFASISATLVINGNTKVAANIDDFNVIFIEALLDGEEDTKATISEDKKTITFSTNKLTTKGDSSKLDYKVKNISTQYDGDVIINCTNEANEYISIMSSFNGETLPLNDPINMQAQEVKSGFINAELTKAVTEEQDVIITCMIEVNATSRTNYAYSLSFDSNGGSKVDDKKVIFNNAYGELSTPIKEDFIFDGWYTEDDNKISESTIFDKKGNQTLYAKWKPVCPYESGEAWTFSFTGSEQVFTSPCKGNYAVELYGAQGGGYDSYIGGKGAYTYGQIRLEKDNNLYIYAGGSGGNNGYNGGGSGSETQAIGGGATDIRLNSNNIENRIMVAAGGGGASRVIHHHTGNSSSGGGCYTKASNVTCGRTLYLYGGGYNSAGYPYLNVYCPVHGYITGCHPDLSMGGAFTSHDVEAGLITCPNVTGKTYSLGCGKSEGQVVSGTAGNITSKSNSNLFQGSTSGGGGFYGGESHYAGTNYVSNDFVNISTKEGENAGNGYAKITYLGK